MDTPAASDS
eukprot:gene27041-biopygen17607